VGLEADDDFVAAHERGFAFMVKPCRRAGVEVGGLLEAVRGVAAAAF
jgi:hypothetical protein